MIKCWLNRQLSGMLRIFFIHNLDKGNEKYLWFHLSVPLFCKIRNKIVHLSFKIVNVMEKISVIIPLFNKEETIVQTIESVLIQDYENYELLVIDDGSTDASKEKISGIQSEKIVLTFKENGGPSSARNIGVRQATGKWIIFLDADDMLEKGALAHFAELIETHPDCSFFCCNHYISKNGERFLYSKRYRNGFVKSNFLAWNTKALMPRAGAAIFRKSLIQNHLFKEYLHRYEDAECLFEIMRTNRCYRDPTPVMTYSQSTLEASNARPNVLEDFIGHLSPYGKSTWEQYALWRLYRQGLKLYSRNVMKPLYKGKGFSSIKFPLLKLLIHTFSKF